MKNVVIFGGAFDPIHNGHVNMAIYASEVLNAEVFFVPARLSVWKSTTSTSMQNKLEMIELAIKDSGRDDILKVDDYEIKSEKETNYSIDTVKHFKNSFPDANLYFLLGTDHVNQFYKWKDCELLASLAHIVFFSRPGYINDQEMIKRFNMLEIKGELMDISSTKIREMKSIDVSPLVLSYIIDNRLYFAGKIKSYMNENRFIHSVSVAKLAYEIADSNHLADKNKYFIAGLIHDIGKDISKEELEEIMNEFYCEYDNFPYQIKHQFVGEYIAKKVFEIDDSGILNAIKYHTTGRANMSLIEKCIYAADKIEPNRGFDSKDFIKEMKVNIEKGFIKVLEANKQYFIERNIQFDNPLTKECFDYYLK